jgi:hypothetical protein
MNLKKIFGISCFCILGSLSVSQAYAGCNPSDVDEAKRLKNKLGNMSYNDFKNKLGGRNYLRVASAKSYARSLSVNDNDLKKVLEDLAKKNDCTEGRHPKIVHVHESVTTGSSSSSSSNTSSSSSSSSSNNSSSSGGKSLQVKVGNSWKFVNCSVGGAPQVSSSQQGDWQTSGRQLKSGSRYLKCPEIDGGRRSVECTCSNGSGENFHINDRPNGNGQSGDVSKHMPNSTRSKFNEEFRFISPNNGFESCLKVVEEEVHSPCNKGEKSRKFNYCMDKSGNNFSKVDNDKTCSQFRLK